MTLKTRAIALFYMRDDKKIKFNGGKSSRSNLVTMPCGTGLRKLQEKSKT